MFIKSAMASSASTESILSRQAAARFAPIAFTRSPIAPRNSLQEDLTKGPNAIGAHRFQPLDSGHAIARPGKFTLREMQSAQRQSATCLEALHRIYNGREPNSPARQLNGNQPVELDIPRDLSHSFRAFLTHPDQRSDYFGADLPTDLPNAHGTFTAGKSVAYSIHEMVRSPGGERHVVVTVGGLTSGAAVDPSTPGRAYANRGRTGHQALAIGQQSLGLPNEMEEFGEVLGQWISRARLKDASLDITVQGHSLGAVAAAKAFQTSIANGQPVKANFYNPAPLPLPENPREFARGVAHLGGERNLRKLAATFKSDRDPVEIIQHAPGARRLLNFAGANWNPDSISTVYRCVDDRLSGLQQHNHPAWSIVAGMNGPLSQGGYGGHGGHAGHGGVPVSIGDAYRAQIVQANRLP